MKQTESSPTLGIFLPILATIIAMATFQIGAAFAKGLFPAVGAQGAATLRLGLGAIMLLAIARPWRVWPRHAPVLAMLWLGLVGLLHAGGELFAPALIPMALVVALFSTAIPFSLDSLRASTHARSYAVFMSLEPALGVLSGLVILQERLSGVQIGGVAAVIIAAAGAAWSSADQRCALRRTLLMRCPPDGPPTPCGPMLGNRCKRLGSGPGRRATFAATLMSTLQPALPTVTAIRSRASV
jgi:threonine/homoserine efflux transporter RhtA